MPKLKMINVKFNMHKDNKWQPEKTNQTSDLPSGSQRKKSLGLELKEENWNSINSERWFSKYNILVW